MSATVFAHESERLNEDGAQWRTTKHVLPTYRGHRLMWIHSPRQGRLQACEIKQGLFSVVHCSVEMGWNGCLETADGKQFRLFAHCVIVLSILKTYTSKHKNGWSSIQEKAESGHFSAGFVQRNPIDSICLQKDKSSSRMKNLLPRSCIVQQKIAMWERI